MSIKYLSALFAGIVTASISLAEVNENIGTDALVIKKLPVCLGKQLLSVPLVPQLQIIQPDGSLRDFRSLYRMNSDRIQKILEGTPIKAKTIVFGSYGKQPPLLDTLLGQKSPYKIRELMLYGGIWEDFESWMGTYPKNRQFPSGDQLFVPTDVRLFGSPVKLSCNRGHVLDSGDLDRRSCLLEGLNTRNSMISVIFNTASDLEGHWPTPTSDWETLAMQGWSNPLMDLEKAVRNIQVNDTGNNICN